MPPMTRAQANQVILNCLKTCMKLQMNYYHQTQSFGYIFYSYKYDFPDSLSYTRFLEVMPNALAPLTRYFTNIEGEPTGI
jgi:hypothetical protein